MTYRFGSFELTPDHYSLRCRGEALDAEPRVLEVLAFLLAHRDRVVSKEELLAEVWEGAFVGDAALSRAVGEVRRVLASGPEGDAARRWIRAVYGRGFSYQGPEVDVVAAVDGDGIEEAADPPAEAGANRIPVPLTPMVGRAAELEEILDRLASTRLLTLTGPGGTGKTRLALEVARRVAPELRHGAVFLPLADVTTAEGLASALALALDVHDPARAPLSAVRRHLSGRRMLLVLDNFEQLVAAAPVVSELLRSGTESVALVTSRFVLQVEGEQEWPVPPLALAEPDATPEELAGAGAIELFVERARAALPSFQPNGEDLAYIARICRRLDGLPLAIELAAARVKLFSPQALWQRLAERLDLLSSPSRDRHRRHRTLESALEWSHDLLEEEERVLFRRLAVFSGGFPLSALEDVCGVPRPPDGDMTELLAALVDRSLVARVAEPAAAATGRAEPRFRLLETTREFARDHLRRSGEDTAVRRAHVRWVRDLARHAESGLLGADQGLWLARLDAERDNLDAALGFAVADAEALPDGTAAAAALGRYWAVRDYSEGQRALESLLNAPAREELEGELQAAARMALGMLCHLLGDYPAATEHLSVATSFFREAGDSARLAQALDHLAWIAAQRTDLDRAEQLSNESLELHRKAGEQRGTAVAYNNLGWAYFFRGRLEEADRCFDLSIDFRRRAADDRGTAYMLINRAIGQMHGAETADLGDAEDWLREARTLLHGLEDKPLQGWLRTAFAMLWLRQGRAEESAASLRESVDAARDYESRDGMSWLHLFLGEAEHRSGRPAEARESLETTLGLARELDAPWIEAEALRRLANLSRDEGREEEARRTYHAALDLAEARSLSLTAAACRRALQAGPHHEGGSC